MLSKVRQLERIPAKGNGVSKAVCLDAAQELECLAIHAY